MFKVISFYGKSLFCQGVKLLEACVTLWRKVVVSLCQTYVFSCLLLQACKMKLQPELLLAPSFKIESTVYDATKKEEVHTYTSIRKHAVYDIYKKEKEERLILKTKKDSGLRPVVLCLIKNQKLSLPRHR